LVGRREVEQIARADFYFVSHNPPFELQGVTFRGEITRAGADLFVSIVKTYQTTQEDLCFVRLNGGYHELQVKSADAIQQRMSEAARARGILENIEALEKRELELRDRCAPLDAVEWQERELARIKERADEEERRLESIKTASDIAGARRK
jgi:hypothetical protein